MANINISKNEMGNTDTPAELEVYCDNKRLIPKMKIKENIPVKIPVLPLNDKL